MSAVSWFLKKHKELADALTAKYPAYSVANSESELSMGNFPAIGLFLGASEHSKQSRTYAPIQYTYILSVFEIYDFDSPDDLYAKQISTFDMLEKVIGEMSYTVLTDIEPVVSIGIEAGSFITGWTTTIVFNA